MKAGWMHRISSLAALAALTATFWVVPVAEGADSQKVLRVIAVHLKGDQAAYLDKVKKLTAISERLKTGATMRVWRATLAGEDVGTIYVGMEHDDLESFAKAMTKMEADTEWRNLIAELDKSGIREVVGNSLLVEITP